LKADLILLAPDFSALDGIWRQPHPFVLWPVGNRSLAEHWMDEAVRSGVGRVIIYTSDRPADLRQHLEHGKYWSKDLQVVPVRSDDLAPAEARRMDRLPGQAEPVRIPDTATGLLEYWLELQKIWLQSRSAGAVAVDEELVPGGWAAEHVRIHPKAKLQPPFWIGAHTEIGPDSRIGPYAVVGSGCILAGSLEVQEAVVMPGSYLGQNTRIHRAIVQGGILVDVRRGCRVDIAENFIISPVSDRQPRTSWPGRLLAGVLWIMLAPLAKLWPGQQWSEEMVAVRPGSATLLQTGQKGSLLLRRWPWLLEILRGSFVWFGILPRPEEVWPKIPAETAERLKSAPCGLFSWADLQGCHDTKAPDEWVHAAYQVLQDNPAVKRMLLRQIIKLALRDPGSG